MAYDLIRLHGKAIAKTDMRTTSKFTALGTSLQSTSLLFVNSFLDDAIHTPSARIIVWS